MGALKKMCSILWLCDKLAIITNFFADHVDAIELPTVTDSSGKPLFTGLYSGPYFDLRRMARNQTVQVGENALIHCAVKQSGEKSVRSGGDVEDTCFEQKEWMGEHERDEVFWGNRDRERSDIGNEHQYGL